MFEDRTPERIKSEILAELGKDTGLSAMAGGFADAMAGPAAEQISQCYGALSALVSIAFPDEGSGGYIDMEGEKYAIYRKPGTRARAAMDFTGREGLTVPAGTSFLTGEGLEFRLLEAVTLADGTGSGMVEAVGAGAAYNVPAGALSRMYVNLEGLERWSSGAAEGGADEERDGALFARVDARRKRPATSGNAWHYEQWALEAPGVGACKVTPLWAGPGTVKVLLVDGNMGPASAEIVAAVEEHIGAERPIGAAVTVESAQALEIHVSAAVSTDGSVTPAQVEAALAKGLDGYLKTISFRQYTLLYNRVAFLLLAIPGVTDYTALTVNGGAGNVEIGAGQVPVLGEVTVS